MDINNLEYKTGPSAYYDPKFKAVLEDHMTNLRNDPETQVSTLDENLVYRWVGDLYGLLRVMGIPAQHFWIIMRMNDMASPTDLSELHKTLLIPASTSVRKILNQYQTLAKTTI